jgi:hypothetical protein
MLIATGLSYDYNFPPRRRITVIAPGIKRRSSPSRPNTVEERDVLLRIEEARQPLVLCAMLPGDKGRALDLAGIADLGRIGVALEQERLRPRAGRNQRPEKQREKEQPRYVAIKRGQSEAASINDWIS